METILELERIRRNWTQSDIGYLAGRMAQSHISGYETQQIPCGKLRQKKISAVLGMHPSELFRDDGFARLVTEAT